MDATPIERVASPAEFAQLIAALPPESGLPYALAGYGMGRRAQIIRLRWTEVDLEVAAIDRGIEWEAPKYEASLGWCRLSPSCSRCSSVVTWSWRARRRASFPATRGLGNHGAAEHWLAFASAGKEWKQPKLQPITLQEARHLRRLARCRRCPPKVASVLMGHATPERQAGAAQITLARYTHALPEDIERARMQLGDYLTAREQEQRAAK